VSDDPLQVIADKHGLWVTFIYVVMRALFGWHFKKIDKLDKKIDEYAAKTNTHLGEIDIKLGVIAERHGIEDRDR